MKRTYRALLLVGVLTVVLGTAGLSAGLLPDLAGHWAAPLVSALEAHGLVSGETQGLFNPDSPLTRIQWAKLIVGALQAEGEASVLTNYPSRFRDLPAWHWGRGYAEALAELGLTRGVSENEFEPEGVVSRAQLAVFLVRAAGLTDAARLQRLEPTQFRDDREIPDWARGELNVAVQIGLFTGYVDGSVRPNQAVTRAEGAVALLRLQEYRGAAYHMMGTLVDFSAATGTVLLRDAIGNQRTVVMSASAQYYRAGVRISPALVRHLDQVWIVVGKDGEGLHLEANYRDFLGSKPTVATGAVTLEGSDGQTQRFVLQPGAPLFLNGRLTDPNAVAGATRAYLVLDIVTGEVRYLDAVRPDQTGLLEAVELPSRTLQIRVGAELLKVAVGDGTVVELGGRPALISELTPGLTVSFVSTAARGVLYLNAER